MLRFRVSSRNFPGVEKEIRLEIAHVLFIDIVGYSKRSINEQRASVDELNEVVRASREFQKAEAAGPLIKIPTGDGMALVFYTSPEAPAQCAVEISRARNEHPRLQLRMGIHSGPVSGVIDVTGRTNLAGAGLNVAQRVMDCGDPGHILLSKHVAEDLDEYDDWRPRLHDLGTCEVKHGVRIGIVNLYNSGFGNAQLPEAFRVIEKRRARVRRAKVAIALLVLAAITAAFVFLLRRPTRSAVALPEKSIAVLPFESLSEDKANAYFATGIPFISSPLVAYRFCSGLQTTVAIIQPGLKWGWDWRLGSEWQFAVHSSAPLGVGINLVALAIVF